MNKPSKNINGKKKGIIMVQRKVDVKKMDGLRIAFCIFFAVTLQRCAGFSDKERLDQSSKILKEMFAPGQYDQRIRPVGGNGSDHGVDVTVDAYIEEIEKFSQKDMEWTLRLTLRQRWKDERLRFDGRGGRINHINLVDTSQLWTPTLIFKNEIRRRFSNPFVKVSPDGKVIYSARLTLTSGCYTDLASYPFGRLQCQVFLVSYGYTTSELMLRWRDLNPVQITNILYIPSFIILKKFITGYCDFKTSTGAYACLKLTFVFQRNYLNDVVVHYIPSAMMIFVSWLAFWVEPKALLTRVALQIFSLLVLLHQTSKIQEALPPLFYDVKAIDVWFGVCLIFVILALVEVVLVNYVARLGQEREREKEKESEDQPDEGVILAETNVDDGSLDKSDGSDRIKKMPPRSSRFPKLPRGVKRIDVVARLSFPVAFGTFLVFYFSIYTYEPSILVPR